ncbi:phosphatidylglycerol lysyltransferase [bacterium BMS3Bbin14]|nr:phosphatidylglycerol lysyltransferase [bacterium BMS3Abin13]GBE51711.1 phosphatidylglycerol lysyltransferase [bacterium BMS3Bbin14]HDO29796.1 bifunctional lysylphosphatidylglycerol flippase/synthetase MprF [Desulfobacteraceae bacterium]
MRNETSELIKEKIISILPFFVGLVLFGGALFVLHRELAHYHLADIRRSLAAIPQQRITFAFLLTVASYLVMSGYDILALGIINHPLPYRKVTPASFIGYAFSNNLGLSMLAGASVRYTLYAAWGLRPGEIGKVVVFCTLTLWLGFLSLGGILFLTAPPAIPAGLHLPLASLRLAGLIFLLVVASYLLLCVVRRKPLILFGRTIGLPRPAYLAPQIVIAVLDWTLAGSVLYVLLPTSPSLTFGNFLGIFLLAQLAGLISQVPGGVGIFETTALLLLQPYFPAPAVLGSLVLYRGMYYLLPLLLAATLLGGLGISSRWHRIRGLFQSLDSVASVAAPWLFSLVAFGGGIILLLSGAIPDTSGRLHWLKHILPLAVAEISHFLASLVGAGLLVLARGLQRRLDAAYVLTILLFIAGIVFSLLKGMNYEEAAVLTIMLGAILPCHRYFYRKAALLSEPFTAGWTIAIGLVFSATLWLIFFSYKHVEYSQTLWWQFAFNDNAPRSLRAMVGAIMVVGFFFLARLMRPHPPADTREETVDMTRLQKIVSRSARTNANLAFLGDKKILFSRSGDAFLMYRIKGRSWVVMGDPVGPVAEWPELIWRFKEKSDIHGGWPVFYEVSHEHLRYYIDIGLMLFKLGEEARVSLRDFSLQSRAAKGLRYTKRRLEKEGWQFTIIPKTEVAGLMPELRAVSDAWLAAKNTREKGFSMGFFEPDYLARFPIALVTRGDDICAFANVWPGSPGGELSIDLMRYRPEAPQGIMDFLFLHLILWGQEQQFQWFNLGMAPLAGMTDHRLAPLWNRVGAFVFRHGEHFYNFNGLRSYKEKFKPRWEPRYLAAPGRVKLLPILSDVAVIISGGIKGTMGK